MITIVTSGFEKNINVLERRLSFVQGFDENSVETHHMEHILYRETVAAVALVHILVNTKQSPLVYSYCIYLCFF